MDKNLRSKRAGAVILASMFLGVLGLIKFMSRPVEKPKPEDYKSKSVVAFVSGFSHPVRIVDVDQDGNADGILTNAIDPGVSRIAYFVPGYEEKLQKHGGHFQKGYAQEMTPEIERQTQKAFRGVNGLSYEIEQERFERSQKRLEGKTINPLEMEGKPINPSRIR